MKTETANSSTKTETFTMPPEVATRLLSNPKNKLTAKMRKRAKQAREYVRESQLPIVRYEEAGRVVGYLYAPDRSKTGGEKLAGKLKVRKFRQLLIWEKRITARIKVLEKVAAALSGILETVVAEHVQNRIKALHAVGGLVQQEIDARG